MCKHEIGELGEPCLYCGGLTVYINDTHSICKNIGCPMWYKPQQWFEEITLPDGQQAIRLKKGEEDGTNQDF